MKRCWCNVQRQLSVLVTGGSSFPEQGHHQHQHDKLLNWRGKRQGETQQMIVYVGMGMLWEGGMPLSLPCSPSFQSRPHNLPSFFLLLSLFSLLPVVPLSLFLTHLLPFRPVFPSNTWPAITCLCTRSVCVFSIRLLGTTDNVSVFERESAFVFFLMRIWLTVQNVGKVTPHNHHNHQHLWEMTKVSNGTPIGSVYQRVMISKKMINQFTYLLF